MINIVEIFERVVSENPEKTAIYDRERRCSFGMLLNCALKLAIRIDNELKGRKGEIIGVFMPKCIEAVIADLAILYSGNAYMNIDVNSPPHRLNAILVQTTPVLILAAQASLPTDIAVLPITEMPPHTLTTEERRRALDLKKDRIDTDPACIINTSGSTGIPKAVVLSHRGFLDFMDAVEAAGLIQENAVIGSLSPIVFDIFSFELCMLAIKGSTLSLLPEKMAAFPLRLLQIMEDTHVSFIFWVPTIMVNIANMRLLEKTVLTDLKMVWFAGEVFPTAKFNYWRKRLPNVLFANFYGPIEISLDCLYFIADREIEDNEPIPIGRPFKNTSVIVLDGENHAVEVGECGKEGELCVRGSSLALGYFRNPEKTAQAFVQNPLNTDYPEIIYRTGDIVMWNEDGDLVFKGRKDTLIKRHGYRIELGEIEHVAAQLKVADNCCALYYPETQKIILVYEASAPLDEKRLSQDLACALPRYMLPNEYRHVSEMPRNPNGKIDRLKLKTIFGSGEK